MEENKGFMALKSLYDKLLTLSPEQFMVFYNMESQPIIFESVEEKGGSI